MHNGYISGGLLEYVAIYIYIHIHMHNRYISGGLLGSVGFYLDNWRYAAELCSNHLRVSL